MMANEERIRPLLTGRELGQCVELQRLVWGFDYRDLVSDSALEHSVRRGGILLGYFSETGSLEGFVYSFPAPLGPSTIQHSHMLGVRPDSRDGGIGNALKWAQYDRARQLGNPLITWTFDPLEARNAHLNLNKLGVRVRRYYVNLYGTNTSSPLHSGVGTDRLLAEWHVRETPLQSIAGRIAPESLPESIRALDSTATANPTHRRPSQPILVLTSDLVAVETPAQTQRMKETDLALARDWREATRRTLKHYLDHGYSICGLWVLDQEPIRTFYCLRADRASN